METNVNNEELNHLEKDYGFVVVHVPHASTNIPDEYRETILLDDNRLNREIRRMTDAFCDDLYDAPGFQNRLIATYSRFVCDVERFRDDRMEKQAKVGQGLMYTHTLYKRKLRNYDEKLRKKIVNEIYDPHHEKLTNMVDDALVKYGKCLIIDGHSFPSRLYIRPNCVFFVPDIDIGTDDYHTPSGLRDVLVKKVKNLGLKVKVNSPFAGAITPMKHYGQDKRVFSVMFEVNRKLYMNEKTMTKSSGFDQTREICHTLMCLAAEYVDNL